MGTSRPWNWRLTVLKTTKMMQIRQLMTGLKMTVRADCCFYIEPPPCLSIKALAIWLWVTSKAVLWASIYHHHPPHTSQSLGSRIKQTFLSNNLAFEQQAAGPYFQLQYHTLQNFGDLLFSLNDVSWWATVHGVAKGVRHDLATKQQQKG